MCTRILRKILRSFQDWLQDCFISGKIWKKKLPPPDVTRIEHSHPCKKISTTQKPWTVGKSDFLPTQIFWIIGDPNMNAENIWAYLEPKWGPLFWMVSWGGWPSKIEVIGVLGIYNDKNQHYHNPSFWSKSPEGYWKYWKITGIFPV